MRVTVCELPHEPGAFAAAWAALCEHAGSNGSELVLLPELVMAEPVWESGEFDAARWSAAERAGEVLIGRLPELGARYVVGTRAVSVAGRRLNQAFLWSADGRGRGGVVQPLRSKYLLPDDEGSWEATWFHPGDAEFPAFRAGAVSLGVNICSELWALETYAAYAGLGVELVLSPRATAVETAARWVAAGVVAAVRAGAYSVSSNRVEPTGACGGGGWIIEPGGAVVAITSAGAPFATRALDLTKAAQAKGSYPRNVFPHSRARAG
jgi:N-carbamoylputrescine amidase